jgi:hypothetical protein
MAGPAIQLPPEVPVVKVLSFMYDQEIHSQKLVITGKLTQVKLPKYFDSR